MNNDVDWCLCHRHHRGVDGVLGVGSGFVVGCGDNGCSVVLVVVLLVLVLVVVNSLCCSGGVFVACYGDDVGYDDGNRRW